jgi:hypothetical protein
MTGLYKATAMAFLLIGAAKADVRFTINNTKPVSTISNNSFLYMTFRDGFSILKSKSLTYSHHWIAYLINRRGECQQLQYNYDGKNIINFNFKVDEKLNYFLSSKKNLNNIDLLESESNTYCYNIIKQNIPQ